MNSHIYYYDMFADENRYKIRGEIRDFIKDNHVYPHEYFDYKSGRTVKTYIKSFELWFGWFRTTRLYLKVEGGLKDVEKLVRYLVTSGWEYHKIVYEY